MMATTHRPRKRFGQHFLHDPGVIDRIIAAIDPRPDQQLVEIGPGEGVLTCELLSRARALDVVELDRDLIEILQANCGERGELRIHSADALRFDFTQLATRGMPLRLIGNLPYNISTPLLFHLLKSANVIQDMHFMLQKEVVDRMVAPPGGRRYGRLSVMVQYRCRAESLFDVAPGAFRPPPKVRSSVVRLLPYEQLPTPAVDDALLARLVRQAFSMRRKTLRNALKPLLGEQDIAACGIDPRVRPETLGVAEFVRLADQLAAHPAMDEQ